MAITLTHTPNEVSFSKNPVVFGFESDRILIDEGASFVASLVFEGDNDPKLSGPLPGTVLIMKMYNSVEVFTFENIADGSENKLPVKVAETIFQYFERLALAFKKNFIINNYYAVTVVEFMDTSGPFPVASAYLLFEAYDKTDLANIDLTNSGPTTSYLNVAQMGMSPIYEKKLFVYAELFAVDGAAENKILSASMPVDSQGRARWDVSAPINDYLALRSMDLSDLSDITTDKDVASFYLRYTEIYGDNQSLGGFFETPKFKAVYGGQPTIHFIDGGTERLKEGGLIKWLSYQQTEGAILHYKQPQWLSWLNLFEEDKNIAVRVKINYDNDTVWYHTAGAMILGKGAKLSIPVSLDSLGLESLFADSTILSYEIYLQADGVRVSTYMKYILDYSNRPFGKSWLYKNSLGAYETLFTVGEKSFAYDLEINKAVMQPYGDRMSSGGMEIDHSVQYQDKLKVYTGYKQKQEIDLFKDFFVSAEKYMFEGDNWVGVNLDTSSVEAYSDSDVLYGLSFDAKVQELTSIWGR